MSPREKNSECREILANLCADVGLAANALKLRSKLCDLPWELRSQIGHILTIASGYHALVTKANERTPDSLLNRLASDALALEKVASAAVVAVDVLIAEEYESRERMAAEAARVRSGPILSPRANASREEDR